MNEDVRDIIAELMKLYDDGKTVIAEFQHTYESVVPSRFYDPTPQVAYDDYGMPHFTTRNPMDTPEHRRLQEVVKKVDDYVTKWVKSGNDLLDKVEQTRYKLQFNDPNQRGFISSSFGETTPTENHLYGVIDGLTMRHAELRQIILELERSNEQTNKPKTNRINSIRFEERAKPVLVIDDKEILFDSSGIKAMSVAKAIFGKKRNFAKPFSDEKIYKWQGNTEYWFHLDKSERELYRDNLYQHIRQLNIKASQVITGEEKLLIKVKGGYAVNPNLLLQK